MWSIWAQHREDRRVGDFLRDRICMFAHNSNLNRLQFGPILSLGSSLTLAEYCEAGQQFDQLRAMLTHLRGHSANVVRFICRRCADLALVMCHT